jgi:hypothetical protein
VPRTGLLEACSRREEIVSVLAAPPPHLLREAVAVVPSQSSATDRGQSEEDRDSMFDCDAHPLVDRRLSSARAQDRGRAKTEGSIYGYCDARASIECLTPKGDSRPTGIPVWYEVVPDTGWISRAGAA